MKIIFNDATEITIQQVTERNGTLSVKTIGNTPEQLRVLFEDKKKTACITVQERGQTLGIYEGYTEFYRTEEYTGKMYGIVMHQTGKSTEERLAAAEENIKDLQENGTGGVDAAMLNASVVVAKVQAQLLSDKEAAQAKVLYRTFGELADIGYTAEEKGYKFVHGEQLYKTVQDNLTFQSQYVPGEGTESLYVLIDEVHAGNKEDPIPYEGNMELENGKYYIQGGVVYLCNRDTGQAVYQSLADLIGIYVEIAE